MKIDWKSEALAFLKLKMTGEKVTAKAYCEQLSARAGRTASLPYFKKVLASVRRDMEPTLRLATSKPTATPPSKSASALLNDPGWPAVREAYLTFKCKSLNDVARRLGVRKDHRGFREAVRGWAKERKALQPAVAVKTAEEISAAGGIQKVRDLNASALAALYRLAALLAEVSRSWKVWAADIRTPWHAQMAAQAAIDLSKAMDKILPAIKGLEGLKKVNRIFSDLSENRIDVVRAALDLAILGVALPKPIEIMLSKHRPEELPPDSGDEITQEQIMARRAEMLAEIETEREDFVRERKQLVARLRDETSGSDSFAAQALEE